MNLFVIKRDLKFPAEVYVVPRYLHITPEFMSAVRAGQKALLSHVGEKVHAKVRLHAIRFFIKYHNDIRRAKRRRSKR